MAEMPIIPLNSGWLFGSHELVQDLRCKENVLIANDTVGQFRVMTVFLGFNQGSAENPKFFQTTCFRISTEGNPIIFRDLATGLLRASRENCLCSGTDKMCC